jgi:hypothetical protein
MPPPPLSKAAKKKGLAALAAAALASPVAGPPATAEAPKAASPRPSPRDKPVVILEEMDLEAGHMPHKTEGEHAIGPPCTPKEGEMAPAKDKSLVVIAPERAAPAETKPALDRTAPSVKDKGLIYTGPSKPSQ